MAMFDLLPSLGIAVSVMDAVDNPLWVQSDAVCRLHMARSLEALRPFLEDPDAEGPRYPYHIYDDLSMRADVSWMEQAGVQFSLTVIAPGELHREWMKTAGHFHRSSRRSRALPEVVEVVRGTGHIALQLMRTSDRIAEISLVSVQRGDWMVVPPGYGHISINTSSSPLIVAHVRSRDIELEYEEMARHRGAGYWVGPQGERINSNYQEVPPLKRYLASQIFPRPFGNEGIYRAVRRHPEAFKFLWNPEIPVAWP